MHPRLFWTPSFSLHINLSFQHSTSKKRLCFSQSPLLLLSSSAPATHSLSTKDKKTGKEKTKEGENESGSTPATGETAIVTEASTTHDSISCDDHFDDGGVGSKEESAKLINRMAEALRRAREDGLPDSANKKPPLSAALAYLARHNIRKRIIHVGSASRMPAECGAPGGGIAYPKLTKFIFDYRIRDPDAPEVFIDDTKKYGKRMELYCGKDFQIEFWEYCLQTMVVGEVAAFMVPPRQLVAFPAVNKKLRDYMLDRTADSANPPKHTCAFMSLQAQGGLGYPDLDDLLAKPRMLEFIFDLHSVVLPHEGPKESWIMTPEEKVEAIPRLRQAGNELYAQGQWFEAATKYEEALNLIEQLSLSEKPGDPEHVRLDQMRVPFYVNMAQCQFKLKDYYGAIRSTSEALTRDTDNVKALFRRAQAYSATSDVQLAEADFLRVKSLAPDTMTTCVDRELANLDRIDRECREQERRLLAGKMFSQT
ncbi:AH receptor-interacting protein [Echinococcus granulosus]|uniref:Aryl hydrocarbon receptor interacting n=1 Tax=Echinococcus granulosus TaxID=6210 RepID=A0A068WIF2_ECHGR|nr:AH receptor-interacting protein [Echinococcus granulosus]CDS19849.1 aryl hydrocarbon receptor interacting [Echinococcus granulosus]